MSQRAGRDDRELVEALRALRVDPPPGAFEAGLRRRLVAAGRPASPGALRRAAAWFTARPRLAWPAAGLAAGCAAFLALAVVRGPAPGRLVADVSTVVPSSKVAIIRLDLTAEVAVARAEVEVRLPEGLVFWSEGSALAQRSFQWTQALSAGRNEIPIPVRGERPGRYKVWVRARIGDERVEHEIPLEVVRG